MDELEDKIAAKRIRMEGEEPGEGSKCQSRVFLQIETSLCSKLETLRFDSPVSFVYNPLQYAMDPHSVFINKYCTGSKKILFVGMNPGPFGMAQTGVPFGEVKLVRDWLCVCGQVGRSKEEHPKRPILGFQCPRSEVSGHRFWTFFKDQCGSPDTFFQDCFVHNYCPLMFVTATGKNITPAELPVSLRNPLQDMCDDSLREVVLLLRCSKVVAIGKYTESRARLALSDLGIQIHPLMHPSPVNPAANKGWAEIAKRQLQEAGVLQYLSPCK